MTTNSDKLTKVFNDAFIGTNQEDIENINNEFKYVLENPLKYTTFRVKRISEYHNDYRYEYTDYCDGSKLNNLMIKTPGVYTGFVVVSPSSPEVKMAVHKLLENDYHDIQYYPINPNIPKDKYYIYVKHNE